MALGSSIYKANVSLANLDESVYEDVSLTMALHPSETEERMMMRLLTFLYCFEERLEFSDGLNNPDSPDIWKKNLMGDVEHWIEIGQPDEKKIKKACGRSERVSIFTFNEFKLSTWLPKIKTKFSQNKKVSVYKLSVKDDLDIHSLVQRTMELNCLLEDQSFFISDQDLRVQVAVEKLKLL